MDGYCYGTLPDRLDSAQPNGFCAWPIHWSNTEGAGFRSLCYLEKIILL